MSYGMGTLKPTQFIQTLLLLCSFSIRFRGTSFCWPGSTELLFSSPSLAYYKSPSGRNHDTRSSCPHLL